MRFAQFYYSSTMLESCDSQVVMFRSPRNFARLLKEGLGAICEVVSTTPMQHYTLKVVRLDGGRPEDDVMTKQCVTSAGDYIGDPRTTDLLINKYGIRHFEKTEPAHCVCSIGYNPDTRTWFGWSHRAIFGFAPGSTCKMGDCQFEPSNASEFLDSLKSWYGDDVYKEPKYTETVAGVNVTYKDCNGKEMLSFEPYPAQWGRGQWVATTEEDAKQMAIAFAKSVS